MNTTQFTKPDKHTRGRGPRRVVLLSLDELECQNRRFKHTGGVSAENCALGFLPAFLDSSTGAVYISRFADGRIAPMHLLDGLPAELVVKRSACGRVMAVCQSVTAGFVCDGYFYTRDQASEIIRRQSANAA